MTDDATTPPRQQGWARLILALAAFHLIPLVPHLRALVPVEQPLLLLLTALGACALVGWWAGGRLLLAVVALALAVLVLVRPAVPAGGEYASLVRGWSLLLAGSFGLASLMGERQRFFPRATAAVGTALFLGLVTSLAGPVALSSASGTVAGDFARRNAQTMASLGEAIAQHPREWEDLTQRAPTFAQMPAMVEQQLTQLSAFAHSAFPALLALQSLAALALAWSLFHRLSRARIGLPLGALRDFRFNDQMVWGLIVGLVIILLPTLATLRGLGRNLIVFFGALYALRGLGVLAWFLAPGALTMIFTIGFALLWVPVIQLVVAFAFTSLAITALGLGLGDTWADWRRRPRPTP
jgi:hypothetical protein